MYLLEKELEIPQELTFQYRHWRRERIGWVLIAVVLAAGLLGIFGHHPLARATTQSKDGMFTIEYDRYARYESNAELALMVEPDKQGDGIIRLWFDVDYLDSLKVVGVSPLPLRGDAREGGRDFVFQSDGHPLTALLSIQFQRVGIVRGRVRINEGEILPITHFVWP